MHDVAEIVASFYVKTWKYTVQSSGFCDTNIIYDISDCIHRDVKNCQKGSLYLEIFQTEINFCGEHGVKSFFPTYLLFRIEVNFG